MTATNLYQWPAAAEFGRIIPKTKFYEHASVTASVRGKFVDQVKRINWAYKLSDDTVHLRGDSTVPEIQVFVVDSKQDDISHDVLKAIDKAVQFPIIFELNRGAEPQAQVRMVAAFKELTGNKPHVGPHFSTDWQRADAPRAPLPSALDLPSLYAGLLTPILPAVPRRGERLSETTARLDQLLKLEREVDKLMGRLRTEPQFNRKVELRQQLRDRTAALAALIDPETPKPEDTPWTS